MSAANKRGRPLCSDCVYGFPLSEGYSCCISQGGKRPRDLVVSCTAFSPKFEAKEEYDGDRD
jgi:hypothetical protein|nr:MAG TPA: hypothetical protein [Caudoviricetes sp.]